MGVSFSFSITYSLSFLWEPGSFFETEVRLRDDGYLVRGRKASDIPPAAALE